MGDNANEAEILLQNFQLLLIEVCYNYKYVKSKSDNPKSLWLYSR